MAPKSTRPGKAEFSIDDFFAEIEKAEDIAASKPLYAERMKNKRALDRAEAAEKEAAAPKTPLEKRRTTKSNNDTATGMSARVGKTKINSVDRVDFDGMGEAPQAGFGHVPSRPLTAREISRTAAADPETQAKLREARLELINAAIDARFPPDAWNVYLFHFSDGDNGDSRDTAACMAMLRDELLPKLNLFCFGQVRSSYGGGRFKNDIEEAFPGEPKVVTSEMRDKDEIYDAIKRFLGKGL